MAGTAKGSGLIAAVGVGSAGRAGAGSLDEFLCNRLPPRPSPILQVSTRLFAADCRHPVSRIMGLPPEPEPFMDALSKFLGDML